MKPDWQPDMHLRLKPSWSAVFFPLFAFAISTRAPVWSQATPFQPVSLHIHQHIWPASAASVLLIENNLYVSTEILPTALGVQISAEKGYWRLRAYGRELRLRPGEREFHLNNVSQLATAAPLLQAKKLYVPFELLRALMPIEATPEDGHWRISYAPAPLLAVRQGSHPDRVRFVFDWASPVAFCCFQEPGKVVIETAAPPEQPEYLRLHQFEEPLASQVTESIKNGLLRLVISHESPEAPQIFTLGDPARIVIDLLRAPMPCEIPSVPPVAPAFVRPAPQDIWRLHIFPTSKGPVRGFIIRFHPQQSPWRLRPALAGETIMQRRPVSHIAETHGAYAALNGGFFAKQGPPLGMLVIAGEWIKAPLYSRAVLGITRAGRCAIVNVDFEGRVEFEGLGMLPLDRINEGHAADNTVVLYTRRWGPVVIGAPDKTRLAVNAEGLVSAIYPPLVDAPLPQGGYVLSGNGLRAQTLANIPQGTKVRLRLETNPRWPDLWHALGGGPLLVREGRICVNGQAERFRPDVTQGTRARSAVGLTREGEIILVAIEKPGMTLHELAATMLRLGAVQAMNLDGGGSTAMIVNGKLLNIPEDGFERSVSNALIVYQETQGY